MSTNYRSTPRFQFDGIKDISQRVEQQTPEARPQHLPHFFMWAQKGKLIPQIMSGGDASKTYGSKTFDLRSKYATHQTVFANTALQNANISMLQRLVPNDAKRSKLRLSMLVVTKTNQASYKRDSDNLVMRDSNGAIIYNQIENIISNSFDASSGNFPTAVTIADGDTWVVSVAGTINGVPVDIGDKISAMVDSPAPAAGSWNNNAGAEQWGLNPTTTAKITTKEITWLVTPITSDVSKTVISTTFDATSGNFPTAGTINAGDTWVASVGGTIDGKTIAVDDSITALVASPTNNWVHATTGVPQWGLNVSNGFSLANVTTGPVANSQIVPVMDFMGEYGDASKLYGLSFFAPTISSSIPVNSDAIDHNLAYVYRLTAKRKEDANSSAATVTTNTSETFIDFTLKQDTIDPNYDNELFLEKSYFHNYENKNVSPRQYADLDGIYVYSGYVQTLLESLETAERAALLTSGVCDDTEGSLFKTTDVIPTDGAGTINVMSGLNYLDFQYEAIRVKDGSGFESLGSAQMRSSVTHYLQEGSDGTLSMANFESAIRTVMNNYDEYVIPYNPGGEPDPRDYIIDFTDIARWPQSAYWDSGFSQDTKTALSNALVRPNLVVYWATHGWNGDAQLLNSEETSAGYTLVSMARLHPESELYGTGCCRALVNLQSGKLLQGPWKKFLPVSLDLLNVISKYMGSGDGIWNTNERFDIGSNKIVSIFDVDTVNHDKKLSARAQDWQNGTVYVQNFDRNQLMRPGVQTVYGDATSVLNSYLTVAAAIEIITICHQTWAEYTGVQTIQGQELLDAINDTMNAKLSGNKFDGVVVVEVSTQYTSRDANNGYSWTTNVILRGPNMKTVGNFTVTSDRMEDTVNA